ncbi:uncharacterized protein EI90DRAFT_3065878 [Cantharellus anzutake]|uniref:uncharacterized protein n=1 Tax=Cantharellus anzutake TaxID=1750568 RepID=UPI00190674D3|nr:uncharacterized protein EI90DRAFT_3065878 [Cantharellus anzutake]KAF8328205.1 hypothetical protein EI90DRAFT_3065878 [Cantharellus anzutake]
MPTVQGYSHVKYINYELARRSPFLIYTGNSVRLEYGPRHPYDPQQFAPVSDPHLCTTSARSLSYATRDSHANTNFHHLLHRARCNRARERVISYKSDRSLKRKWRRQLSQDP